jgi:hypothetical protein
VTTDHDPAVSIRASVARTRGEGTAAVRYRVRGLWGRASLVQWLEDPGRENAHGVLRRLDAVRAQTLDGVRTVDGPAGRIDLDGDRSMHGVGDGWMLFIDGTSYIGAPGEWELDDEGDGLSEEEPQWLLALLVGCVQAEDRGLIELGGTRWHHYRTVCDLSRATQGSSRALLPPLFDEGLDRACLPVDVWLDSDRRIRRAVFHNGQDRTVLELSDFGAPPRVLPPTPDEILDEEGG